MTIRLSPGLANLAEAMHRHGAKCAVQIQHPGKQAAWPRRNLISASDNVADLPGSAGHEVIYAEGMEPCHRDVMMKRFGGGNGEGLRGKAFAKPVTIIVQSTVTAISEEGEVTLLDNAFHRSTIKVDHVVLATVEKDDRLFESLFDAGLNVAKIGDAAGVRNVRGAVTDGANAALALEKDSLLNANGRLIADLPTEVQLQLGK